MWLKVGRNILAVEYTESNPNDENFEGEGSPETYKILSTLEPLEM